ncbi:MAG: N-sulfoglucosamine sulfohydrolase [Akkermansiaceae bacterium]|jgi:N-sulfoglucosamine sulfohydrolase
MKFLTLISLLPSLLFAKAPPLNILLFTADDLGHEQLDFHGGGVPEVTPNLSKFSANNHTFLRAHVNIAICAPSRSIIATGRYGHNSGCYGFNPLPKKIPTVFAHFQNNGYLTGILGKVPHSTTDTTFTWDFARDYRELGNGRSPKKYHDYSVEFFNRSQKENKPFYFMVNSHDPHRPFHDPNKPMENAEEPTKLFKPNEIEVPPFLPDLPEVRKELAQYYNSIRRLDDTFGRVMEALKNSGLADSTLVLFITDNGSAFPFAKANTYLASTRTPLIVRWPGVTKPGTKDNTHFVSEVDFFPTFTEATGLPTLDKLDGRSFVSLIKGESQDKRDVVFTQIDYTIGGPPKPMRCIQNEKYAYIFNAFSDGKFKYKNNNEGLTFKAMQKEGKTKPEIQARVDLFRHRVVEEFYDFENDPGSTKNLIDSPAHQEVIAQFQKRLRNWMVETNDHNRPAFDVRKDPKKLAQAINDYPKMIKSGTRSGKAKKSQ